ncbi:hypothetical protein LCGC14_1874700 [marine sediment metagenome]|uniref:Uncharacterized protein n=1 Tax=marine sediment metagenome TaxID=412755 RepID=A0A0F9J2P6_9ZZZZ
MKIYCRRFKQYGSFGFKHFFIGGLHIFAFRLGWGMVQINIGKPDENSEFMRDVRRGLEDIKAGRMVPLSEVKKELEVK